MKNLLNASNYLFILIFSLILFSRMGHDLTPFSIPDASFVLFLVGGFLLRKSHFLALMLIGLLIIDIYALSKLNGNQINLEVTYFIHLFCYLIPWFFASNYLHHPITFSKFFKVFFAALFLTYLFSNTSYYFYYGLPPTINSFTNFIIADALNFVLINTVYGLIFTFVYKLTLNLKFKSLKKTSV